MQIAKKQLLQMDCEPCEKGGSPLPPGECAKLWQGLTGWEILGGRVLQKKYVTKDFRDAMAFANRVAELAEQQQHHPDLHISYRWAKVHLTTHAVGGLSMNDFILAAKIDEARSQMAA
jgi:4a-hydroxytetrahydrobiopterin dehydratase